MSRAAQSNASLFLVTLANPDGSTKTVLKSKKLDGAISCYEMTQEQISALYLAGHPGSHLLGNRGVIYAAIRHRIALFAIHERRDPHSKKLIELDDAQQAEARNVAVAISSSSPLEVPTLESPFAIPDYVLDAALNGDEDITHRLLRTNARYLVYRGSATDFSGRRYNNITPFQAALITGDVEMALMMKPFFTRLPNGEAIMQEQFKEIFPEGVEAHEIKQQDNAFQFNAILEAICAASPADLDAALNKIGAEFTQSDSAREKPDRELSLIEALNRFREQFAQHSHNEKIFNPQHLLCAFEVSDALWDQCERDGSDRGYKKRDLFWRQIIGFCQRFMPACYAQAFSQGLLYLVKVDQNDSWYPETFKRDLKLRRDDFSYFPLPLDSRSGLGFDFAIYGAIVPIAPCLGMLNRVHGVGYVVREGQQAWCAGARFFQKLLSSKNNWLSEHYAASSSAVVRSV